MASIVLQNFYTWEANKNKNEFEYVNPTSKSTFTVISPNEVLVNNSSLWSNLLNGDIINCSGSILLPSPLTATPIYISKGLNLRISLYNNLADSIKKNNPINLSGGTGIHTLEFNFNKLFRVNKGGETGITEPIWNRNKNGFTDDNTIQWVTVNPLVSPYSVLDLLPKARQQEDLFIKYSQFANHSLALGNEEAKPIFNKYKDYFNLDEIYNYETLIECGYGYLANASILQVDGLSKLLGYLKLIHFLKGTRLGLKLVLKLLGYPNTDIVWYEKTPIGEPHTFDLNLDFNYQNFTPKVLANLVDFLRNYVFPICTINSNILPFELIHESLGGTGLPDYIFDCNAHVDINLNIISKILFKYLYNQMSGSKILDSDVYKNDAYIIPSFINPDILFKYIYKLSNFPILDIATKNNNAVIISSILYNNKLLKYIYTEISGNNLSDISGKNNTGNIINSIKTNKILFKYIYTENSGLNLTDTSGKNNNANIISTGSVYPRYENIIANYLLDTGTLDSGHNAYDASLSGNPAFVTSKYLEFNNNSIDCLNIPKDVLNGRVTFSISFWVKIKNFNTSNTSSSNYLFTASNSTIHINEFGLGYIFGQGFIFMLEDNIINYGFDNLIEDNNFHLITLTRNSSGLIKLYLDKNNLCSGILSNLSLLIDNNGFVFNQIQTSVGGGFDINQSGNIDLAKILFYDIELTQNEIYRIYNLGL